MPIYGYACSYCGHTLDALQKMADAPLVDCPECEQPKLKRQLSAPRFRLKGSGWYETDFKADNQRNIAGDAKAAAANGASGDKKTDSTTSTSDSKTAEPTTKETKKTDSKATESKTSSSEKSA